MSNIDLLNQMNQNLINSAIYYMSEDSVATTRIVSNTEAIILLGFTGFLVLFTIFVIWDFLRD